MWALIPGMLGSWRFRSINHLIWGSEPRTIHQGIESSPTTRVAMLQQTLWFDVVVRTNCKYCGYAPSSEYLVEDTSVGACRFIAAPKLNSLAEGVMVSKISAWYWNLENSKILSRSGLIWPGTCNPAMEQETLFADAPKVTYGEESGSLSKILFLKICRKLKTLSISVTPLSQSCSF